MSTDAAGFAARYGPLSCSPLKGFRRWAPARPVSRPDRETATGPPGSCPDRTCTGWRRRASDQVMTAGQSPPDALGARNFGLGGKGRVQSQPALRAMRMASMRFRAPTLLIALDR